MPRRPPQIKSTDVFYKDRVFNIEYFYRQGEKRDNCITARTGRAKENYYEACKSPALTSHTLLFFDNPGTGNSTYFEDYPLNIDDLTEISSLFIKQLGISNFILCGTSMGGLTSLLYLNHEPGKVKAYINIEGNLLPEDCMFSSKVVSYDFETFASQVFPKTISDMREKGNMGYHIIANNLQLNTNIKSYYNYCFQTVEYSSTGELLAQFKALKIPMLFIYGEENNSLSYIPELRKSGMTVKEISNSNHFIFYDNPKELYDVIGDFINEI